uniref:CULLIN_2 domain-containing protein n=1 Tax=Rhabditophanes sp. KR3021 TaxID=114890 RepID=A0AC35TGS0_9BILA
MDSKAYSFAFKYSDNVQSTPLDEAESNSTTSKVEEHLEAITRYLEKVIFDNFDTIGKDVIVHDILLALHSDECAELLHQAIKKLFNKYMDKIFDECFGGDLTATGYSFEKALLKFIGELNDTISKTEYVLRRHNEAFFMRNSNLSSIRSLWISLFVKKSKKANDFKKNVVSLLSCGLKDLSQNKLESLDKCKTIVKFLFGTPLKGQIIDCVSNEVMFSIVREEKKEFSDIKENVTYIAKNITDLIGAISRIPLSQYIPVTYEMDDKAIEYEDKSIFSMRCYEHDPDEIYIMAEPVVNNPRDHELRPKLDTTTIINNPVYFFKDVGIVEHVREHYIRTYQDFLLQNIKIPLEGKDYDTLHLIFDLFIKYTNSTDDLIKMYIQYIIEEIAKIERGTKLSDFTAVGLFIKLHFYFIDISTKAFNGNPKFTIAIQTAFKEGLKAIAKFNVGEYIAKYMHSQIRKGLPDIEKVEFGEIMSNCINLLRYVEGKESFAHHYTFYLAKRLLDAKKANVEVENQILKSLKAEIGDRLTYKWEHMVTDMTLSDDIMTTFHDHLKSSEISNDFGFEFKVKILTAQRWPTHKAAGNIGLPSFLLNPRQQFYDFYTKKYAKKKLAFNHDQDSITIRTNFANGSKELEMGMCHACVLLLFEDRDQYLANEISEMTFMSKEDTASSIQSLVAQNILKKSSKRMANDDGNSTEEDKEYLNFNVEFTSKSNKVVIKKQTHKPNVEKPAISQEDIVNDRKFRIECYIVSFLKKEKSLTFQALHTLINEKMKIPIPTAEFKEKIESLISKNFCARSTEDMSTYVYVT